MLKIRSYLVSWGIVPCLQIYLPSSPDLPTVISDLPTIVFKLFFKISPKIQHGDHFPFLLKKIHMVIIFWFHHGDHFLMLIIFCTPMVDWLTYFAPSMYTQINIILSTNWFCYIVEKFFCMTAIKNLNNGQNIPT